MIPQALVCFDLQQVKMLSKSKLYIARTLHFLNSCKSHAELSWHDEKSDIKTFVTFQEP